MSRQSIQDLDKNLGASNSTDIIGGLEIINGDIRNPWCRLVHPYLDMDGLPEGQMDLPCAMGVEDAQKNAKQALDSLVKGYGAN